MLGNEGQEGMKWMNQCNSLISLIKPMKASKPIKTTSYKTQRSPSWSTLLFTARSNNNKYTYITTLMNRNQNKIYNSDSSNNLQRRFVSPKDQRTSKGEKIQEYRSAERDANAPSSRMSHQTQQAKAQKIRTQNSGGETPSSSRSNTQKDKSNSHTDRLKKDYMASNLAKFNRKRDEKMTSSNVSQKSNPSNPHNSSKEKKQRYIYTFKEEIQGKNIQQNQVNQQYSGIPMPSSIEKIESSPSPSGSQIGMVGMISEVNAERNKNHHEEGMIEDSEIRQNSTSVVVSSKGKAIEVNVVKYQDRNNFKKEERNVKQSSYKQITLPRTQPQPQVQSKFPQKSQRMTENFAQKPSLSFRTSQQPQQPQHSLPFPISTSSSQSDSNLLIQRLQSQRNTLIQSNTHLLEQKLHLSGQLSFLQRKCQEYENQISLMRETAARNGRQAERVSQNNQKMFMELESRYNTLLQEYRAKSRQAAEMSGEVVERERKVEDLASAVRGLEEEGRTKGAELDRMRKIYEAKLMQMQQDHQFQLRQMQIRNKEQKQREKSMEETINHLRNELSGKDREMKLQKSRIQEIELQLRDRNDLQGLLSVKQTQNNHLKTQLKKTKEFLQLSNQNTSETIQRLTTEGKEKDRRIKELTQMVSNVKNKQHMQRITHSAQTDLYGGTSQEDNGGFQDFIRNQSAETNRLRSDLSARQEEIFTITTQRDELRQKLRRVEQELQMASRTHAANIANITQVKQATEMMLKKRIAALQALRNVH